MPKFTFKHKWTLIPIILIILAIYYYVALPVVNIHNTGTWLLGIVLIGLVFVFYTAKKHISWKKEEIKAHPGSNILKYILIIAILALIIGSILSSPIINANKYQKLMPVQNGTFAKDVKELEFSKIPILDKSTAELLGDRKMGSMVDMVSQFEADDRYTQINYKGNPVRVSPLKYASVIKWLTNQNKGIPAYIRINMATQATEIVKLKDGMKYTTSDHFNRNIYRHLRFAHPTYIYGDLSFEIDEEGTPYWIAPVKKYNIGLFGGETVGRAVICNAITGECKDYAIKDVPQWVDRVFSADLLVNLFNYHGSLKHGFLNSVLGQKDCVEATDGYNYLALDDDVWMYTGVTSVNGDQSNVGFVLANQRTMQTKYYTVEGATESSAMKSAEGQVQNLNYDATFPLLLNISGEPTYFISLKDDSGLVKKYAMVNVQKYQIVGIGDTVSECQEKYLELLSTNGIKDKEQSEKKKIETTEGSVEKITPIVVDGNSHYYITLKGDTKIYDISIVSFPESINLANGDKVTIEYQPGEKINTILTLKSEKYKL
ncbi:MAG: CvpA family protein [Lachnospiraceae bacterium]|nr:CvpA family protein [Lachnospiraceae bacterium]